MQRVILVVQFSLYLDQARLKIKFINTKVLGDAYRMKCDITIGKASKCDVYIRISINGEIVKDFKSELKVIKSQVATNLDWVYATPEPISLNSKIVIEMFDHDEDSEDDLMAKWTLSPDQIGQRTTLSSGRITRNELTIEAKWL